MIWFWFKQNKLGQTHQCVSDESSMKWNVDFGKCEHCATVTWLYIVYIFFITFLQATHIFLLQIYLFIYLADFFFLSFSLCCHVSSSLYLNIKMNRLFFCCLCWHFHFLFKLWQICFRSQYWKNEYDNKKHLNVTIFYFWFNQFQVMRCTQEKNPQYYSIGIKDPIDCSKLITFRCQSLYACVCVYDVCCIVVCFEKKMAALQKWNSLGNSITIEMECRLLSHMSIVSDNYNLKLNTVSNRTNNIAW